MNGYDKTAAQVCICDTDTFPKTGKKYFVDIYTFLTGYKCINCESIPITPPPIGKGILQNPTPSTAQVVY